VHCWHFGFYAHYHPARHVCKNCRGANSPQWGVQGASVRLVGLLEVWAWKGAEVAIGELWLPKMWGVVLAHTAGDGTLGSSVFTHPLTSVFSDTFLQT